MAKRSPRPSLRNMSWRRAGATEAIRLFLVQSASAGMSRFALALRPPCFRPSTARIAASRFDEAPPSSSALISNDAPMYCFESSLRDFLMASFSSDCPANAGQAWIGWKTPPCLSRVCFSNNSSRACKPFQVRTTVNVHASSSRNVEDVADAEFRSAAPVGRASRRAHMWPLTPTSWQLDITSGATCVNPAAVSLLTLPSCRGASTSLCNMLEDRDLNSFRSWSAQRAT